MNSSLFIATRDGVIVAEHDANDWRETARALRKQNASAIAARDDTILAGTRDGIFRSDDAGKTWRAANDGLTIQHLRWLAIHPDDATRALAGTERAGIFVSRDGGARWRECAEVARLRDQFRWSLPYSPEAGCIRGFAFNGARGYAAAEVGGALVSDDFGESWRLVDGSDGKPSFGTPRKAFVHPDVHSIAVHPSSPDLVYAPTGGGFYRSRDGGKTWTREYACYCRAVWIDPADPEHFVLGPADSVDQNGRIEESRDGGKTWQSASKGLRVPWRNHMVERFAPSGGELLAVLSNGELLAAPVPTLEWRAILPDVKDVTAVAAIA